MRQTVPQPTTVYPWNEYDDAGHIWHQAYQQYLLEYGFGLLDLEAQHPWLPTSEPYQEHLASQHHPGHAAP